MAQNDSVGKGLRIPQAAKEKQRASVHAPGTTLVKWWAPKTHEVITALLCACERCREGKKEIQGKKELLAA